MQIHAYIHTQTRIHNGQYITIIINVCCGCTNCVFLMAWLCTTPPQYSSIWGGVEGTNRFGRLKENVRKNPGQIKRIVISFQTWYRIPHSPRNPSQTPRLVDVSIIPRLTALYSLLWSKCVTWLSPDAKRKIEAPHALLYFASTAFECRLHLLMFSLHVWFPACSVQY